MNLSDIPLKSIDSPTVGEIINTEELTDLIYDKLFDNQQYPQLDLDQIVYQDVDAKLGVIHIETNDKAFVVNVCQTHKYTPEELG